MKLSSEPQGVHTALGFGLLTPAELSALILISAAIGVRKLQVSNLR